MPFSREELDDLLAARAYERLIGQVETPWFDAKDQPYDVDTDGGKRALARDVAAFANSSGGTIVIGVRTTKSAVHFADEVVKIRPIERHRVDSGRYHNVVADWVFPWVDGFEIEWLPTGDDTRGLFAIRIPAQAEELKPFLVVRTLDGEKIVETLFGYTARRGDVNRPMGVADLQRALRAGLQFERLEERLSAIETLLQNPPATALIRAGDDVPTAAIDVTIARAAGDGDFPADRTSLFAAPPRSLELEDAFWDAVIQLPSWPESYRAVAKLLLDISVEPEQGLQVKGTQVYMAKTVAELPNDTIVRLVVYYAHAVSRERETIRVLFVDDYDHPTDPTAWPHVERLRNRSQAH